MTIAFSGKVWVFGDNLNTDAMYPAFAMKMDPPEAAKHIFYEVRPGWTDQVSLGDIVLAGKNFGLGSSRPVAALFTELGVAGLVAEEFNSLFFRNAVNAGLPAMTVPNATDVFHEGDTGTFDLTAGTWRNDTTGASGTVPETPRTDPRHHRERRRAAAIGGAGLPAGRAPRRAAVEHGRHARRRKRRLMALLGRLLRGVRAGAHRSPLAGRAFDAPESITVTSSAFTDGGPMPPASAGKGVGDNTSPPLRWDGSPPGTRQLVLVMDDVDVPLPRPLLHTIAVLEPTLDGVAAGSLRPGSDGMRFIRADLGDRGYADPARSPAMGRTATGFMSSRSTSRFRRPSPAPSACWPR